jgi:hypothetical protein
MTIRPPWSRLRWNFRLIASAASAAATATALLTLTLNGRLALLSLRSLRTLRTLGAQQQGRGRDNEERQHES